MGLTKNKLLTPAFLVMHPGNGPFIGTHDLISGQRFQDEPLDVSVDACHGVPPVGWFGHLN